MKISRPTKNKTTIISKTNGWARYVPSSIIETSPVINGIVFECRMSNFSSKF